MWYKKHPRTEWLNECPECAELDSRQRVATHYIIQNCKVSFHSFVDFKRSRLLPLYKIYFKASKMHTSNNASQLLRLNFRYLTFLAAHFTASVLCRHIPFDAGVQHAEQNVHTRESLSFADGSFPLLHCGCYLEIQYAEV